MPTTYTLDAISKAFPLISNRIRATVASESDPLAPVASIIDTTSLHPQRVWHFAGLPRDNYRFSLDEIDISGNVLTNLSLFDVVPGFIEGFLERADEQIKVGTTPGFDNLTNTAVFDGTGGKPDYVGWDIVPSELNGRGILVEGLDYSWDKDTATLLMLQVADVFATGTVWNIHFNPRQDLSSANSVSTVNDFNFKVITDDYTLSADDFGGGIIIEPNVEYMEVTFPDIATVKAGRLLRIETGDTGDMYCVKFVSTTAFKFARGNVYMIPNETLIVYKYIHPTTGAQWRITDAVGNFLFCGNIVSNDTAQVDTYGMQLLDGSLLPITKYARLYNEYVLNLPIGWAVTLSAWSTGDNNRKFSLESGGSFRIPDRRNLYERFLLTGASGDYLADMVGPHTHPFDPGDRVGLSDNANDRDVMLPGAGPARNTGNNTGTETRPKTYLTNKYIVL